jgi:hypothetical protein
MHRNPTICDVENCVHLHVLAGKPILARDLGGLNGGVTRRFHT